MNLFSVEINDFISYVGVNDRETELFENLWPLEKGVAYNSYLIKGEKTALLDTVKITKVEEFKEKLAEALDGKDLDYLVIHHMEPDHSGSIATIKSLYPNVKIVGNKKTTEFLSDFYSIKDDIIEIEDGQTLDLGSKKLTFYMTPMVHWPESMVSYEETSGTLFSQDAFGSFGTLDGGIFDDELNFDFYESEARRYFSNIVGKFSRPVQNALKKLSGLEIKMICPTHGPIWRTKPEVIVNAYDSWSKHEVQEGVVIVYGSMYGNTQQMADILARKLSQEGVRDIIVFDASKTHQSHILNEIWKYRGLILGSCTYNNAALPTMTSLISTLKANKLQNHTLGIFGNYSWSGGGVKDIKEFAEGEKFELLETIVEAKCSACQADISGLEKMAKEMVDNLKSHR